LARSVYFHVHNRFEFMKTFTKSILLFAACLLVLAACKTKKVGNGNVPNDFHLEIQHVGCRGNCPAYNIKVDAKGNATYQGRRAVEMVGDYRKTLDAKTMEALAKAITDAHFFDFDDEYGGEVADVPGVKTIVIMDGKTKTVNDIRNAPKELKEMEAKLEELIGKEGWEKIEN
jgi:hypothetical protein